MDPLWTHPRKWPLAVLVVNTLVVLLLQVLPDYVSDEIAEVLGPFEPLVAVGVVAFFVFALWMTRCEACGFWWARDRLKSEPHEQGCPQCGSLDFRTPLGRDKPEAF